MKRIAIFALAFLLLAFQSQAKDINVKSLGAKADGKTKVTKSIQKAIDAVSASGGGRVTLSGGTFLSGPIEIKSGVELYIDADAVLLASPDISDFPDRTYNGTLFPAGPYDALQIVLGDGAGNNWWCVLFPPLCIVTRDGSASLDGVAQDASTPVTFESDILAFLRDLFGWS